MRHEFKSRTGEINGRTGTVNGSFEVLKGTDQEIWVDIYGPGGGIRQRLEVNWSDALVMALQIIQQCPADISGAYHGGPTKPAAPAEEPREKDWMG
jgi:hypothetical protein